MSDRRVASVGAWLAIGVGIGAALGVAMDNIGLWLPIGLVVGLVIGMAMANRHGGSS